MICNSFIVFVLRPTLMYANTLEVPTKNGIKDLILSSKLGNDLNTCAPVIAPNDINPEKTINVLTDLKKSVGCVGEQTTKPQKIFALFENLHIGNDSPN